MDFLTRLDDLTQAGIFSPRQREILQQFYHSYAEAHRAKGEPFDRSPPITLTFLDRIAQQIQTPHPFQPYHDALREPFDYLSFGLELIRPLVDFSRSVVIGESVLAQIEDYQRQGHNSIFFANHQIEPDPQILHLLLEQEHGALIQETIFVAGHRVIADPIAVPFSAGRNMLCIYSRRHMENAPEEKAARHTHNRIALQQLTKRLAEGSVTVYVAPSGGRDRMDATGSVQVAPFDQDAINLFALIAKDAGVPTHFYPLSLATYPLLPPPPVIEQRVGEDRTFFHTPVGIAFGEELNMAYGSDQEALDKKSQRKLRADYIYRQVCDGYNELMRQLSSKNDGSLAFQHR